MTLENILLAGVAINLVNLFLAAYNVGKNIETSEKHLEYRRAEFLRDQNRHEQILTAKEAYEKGYDAGMEASKGEST